LIRAPEEAGPGDRINTRLARGSIWSIVDGEAGGTRRPKRHDNPSVEPPQMDLFEPDH
jgi:hypothetical protein